MGRRHAHPQEKAVQAPDPVPGTEKLVWVLRQQFQHASQQVCPVCTLICSRHRRTPLRLYRHSTRPCQVSHPRRRPPSLCQEWRPSALTWWPDPARAQLLGDEIFCRPFQGLIKAHKLVCVRVVTSRNRPCGRDRGATYTGMLAKAIAAPRAEKVTGDADFPS